MDFMPDKLQIPTVTLSEYTIKPQSENSTKRRLGIHRSMRFIIILGNFFGLLPVIEPNLDVPGTSRFTWKSWKVMYIGLLLVAAVFMLFTGIIYLFKKPTFDDIVDFIFYTHWSVAVLVFLNLGRNWPKLMQEWSKVDTVMERNYRYPFTLDKRLKIMAGITMALAAVEYGLSVAAYIQECVNLYGYVDFSNYYTNRFPSVFDHFEGNFFLAAGVQVISVLATFTWNYNDLFIILISTALAVRFKQITQRLLENERKANSNEFWIEIREDYDRLCNLCKELDRCLSLNVLVSFACNLFFILAQLFNSLKPIEDAVQKVYFFYSFAFLILRTVAVSLYAAWINDESKEPTSILHSVPSATYNSEIRRFLLQISFDDVALTGSKMFQVTRGLILNVAGAIVTYELVLIQFNLSAQSE